MRARKSLLLSGGILAIVALLGASNVSAQACDGGPCRPTPPLVESIGHQTMANGCQYIMTVDPNNNFVIDVIVDPAGPENATVFPNELCAVTVAVYDICENETGLTYCPQVKRGRQPIQGAPGGICYYPKNIKVTC